MNSSDTARGAGAGAYTRSEKKGKLQKVLVIRKTTCYMDMLQQNDGESLRLVAEGHPSVAGIKATHDQNEQCFQTVDRVLRGSGLEYLSVFRHDDVDYNGVDLIVTVGGDGSFIDAAHHIDSTVAVLGVKSATSSHGHFCLANSENFELVLQNIRAGFVRPRKLARLSMTVDGVQIPLQVVNEVVIGELDLAGTNRYSLAVNGRTERQKGTALVVSTAAGSTGFLRSACGIIQPILARRFQYKPLLPILDPEERQDLPGGLVSPRGELRVMSGMPEGLLHVDGKYLKFPFKRGSELVVRVSEQDLLAYIDPRCHDRYMKHKRRSRR